MDQKTEKLNPFAPLLRSDQDLEQRLEKKLNDAISFNNSINDKKEMITYFKDKTTNQKRNIKKTITTFSKSFETFVIIATTSSSITLSPTVTYLIVIPMSTASIRAFSIGNKVIYEIVMQRIDKNKKNMKKINKLLNHSINCNAKVYNMT